MSRTDYTPLLDRLRQVQDALPFDVQDKPMFGGSMHYADGRPFASLSKAGFAIKLPVDQQADLLAVAGATRLRYSESDSPSRQYVVLPDSVLQDDERLITWLRRSTKHVAAPVKRAPGR